MPFINCIEYSSQLATYSFWPALHELSLLLNYLMLLNDVCISNNRTQSHTISTHYGFM